MLNEEKVILMTKMAAFIDREGKKNDAINTYFKSDYVGYNIIKAVIVQQLYLPLALLPTFCVILKKYYLIYTIRIIY